MHFLGKWNEIYTKKSNEILQYDQTQISLYSPDRKFYFMRIEILFIFIFESHTARVVVFPLKKGKWIESNTRSKHIQSLRLNIQNDGEY